MITVNRSENLITGSVNGQPFSVTFSEEKYKEMLALEEKANKVETMEELKAIVNDFIPLTKESYKEIVETITPYIHVNRATNQFFLKWNNVISSRPLPNAFAEKLITSVEKGIDIMPLLKCWVRFQRNPNYTAAKAELFSNYITSTFVNQKKVNELVEKEGLSTDKAVELATTNQVAITKEGLLVTYKVLKEVRHKYELNENEEVITKSRYTKSVDPDTGLVTYQEPEHDEDRLFEPPVQGQSGDEFTCIGNGRNGKGHHIRVGCLHALESWSQVDCNDSHSCVKGLHAGNLSFIRGYQQDGTVTANVFVDPMHIGAIVPHDDNAMRVKQYFVHSIFNGVNKNIYHSSTYAAITDKEFQVWLEEVVKASKQKQEAANREIDEANSLV